jgi:hypothetical protein
MSDNIDFLYDDDEAIKFIRNTLSEDTNKKFSDDDLNYIVDLIYDFYNTKGFFDEDDDDADIEINEDELIAYVVKNALSDKVGKFDADDVTLIIQGEIGYCDSLGMFE